MISLWRSLRDESLLRIDSRYPAAIKDDGDVLLDKSELLHRLNFGVGRGDMKLDGLMLS
jgi:hypothetical protein